jgi:hypothetical protein
LPFEKLYRPLPPLRVPLQRPNAQKLFDVIVATFTGRSKFTTIGEPTAAVTVCRLGETETTARSAPKSGCAPIKISAATRMAIRGLDLFINLVLLFAVMACVHPVFFVRKIIHGRKFEMSVGVVQ